MERRRKAGWLVRHPRDRVPASLILTLFAAQLGLFLGVHGPSWQLVAILLLLPALFVANAVLHNHYHHPTFRFRVLNRLYETILFFQTGIPAYGWQLSHNLGHHRHWRNQDPASPEVDEYRWLEPDGRVTPRVPYTLRTYVTGYTCMVRNGPRHPTIFRRFKIVLAINAILLAGLLWFDPLGTVVVFILPMVATGLAMAWFSYAHHVGLKSTDPCAASYTRLDRFSNIISFNTGYHTAHHVHPGVHWSDLPAFHARIAHKIPAHCYHHGKFPNRFNVVDEGGELAPTPSEQAT